MKNKSSNKFLVATISLALIVLVFSAYKIFNPNQELTRDITNNRTETQKYESENFGIEFEYPKNYSIYFQNDENDKGFENENTSIINVGRNLIFIKNENESSNPSNFGYIEIQNDDSDYVEQFAKSNNITFKRFMWEEGLPNNAGCLEMIREYIYVSEITESVVSQIRLIEEGIKCEGKETDYNKSEEKEIIESLEILKSTKEI